MKYLEQLSPPLASLGELGMPGEGGLFPTSNSGRIDEHIQSCFITHPPKRKGMDFKSSKKTGNKKV